MSHQGVLDEEHFRKIADAALSHYDVSPKSLTFIGHGDNLTFRVDTHKERFLLRIHAARAATLRGDWQSAGAIASELEWLSALRRDTDIVAQSPVAAREGGFVCSVDLQGSVVSCTLLSWINGEALSIDAPRTPEQITALGSLLAKLHGHARRWIPESGFTRPSYDGTDLQAHLSSIDTLIDSKVIPAACGPVFKETMLRLRQIVAQYRPDSRLWGLIHADLHESNYLACAGILRPIDFSRCGFGFYLFDIAGTLHHVGEKSYTHFFAGYRQSGELPDGYERLLDAFFLWRLLANFSFLASSPQEVAYLSKTIPWTLERYFNPFLAGQPILRLT